MPKKKNNQVARNSNIFTLLKEYKFLVIIITLVAAISNGTNIILPSLIARGIDAYNKGINDVSLIAWEFFATCVVVLIFAYLQTLSRGTVAAIQGAVTGIQTGAQCNVIENYTYGGSPQAGFLTVVVDDGTGSPGSTFMTAAQTAVNNMRSGAIQCGVYAPTIITANVSFTILTSSNYVHATLVTSAQSAVTGYINSLLDGQQLSWSYIADVIYASSPGIYDVTNVLLNGGTADIVPASVIYVIKAGTVTGT